ncbi:MAG TPA: hypothetical protein VHD62_15205 [Opitutaceae bacterium]|nr:hypothetical protein [Opitutaceae bacterium]
MPSFTLPHREALASPIAHVENMAAPERVTPTQDAAPSSADSTPAAQRAVETVLSLAERFASTDRHTVNLHFSIGGSDLQVRVEMRADEVRTAFRTESPELRDALAHEWQAIDSQAGDRAIRFADPVFSSSPSTQDGASQQQPQHREPAARPLPADDARLFRGAGHRDANATADATPARAATPILGHAARLHAFA